jgi:XRE family transcriptional regulator, regulator of sulfur utilization
MICQTRPIDTSILLANSATVIPGSARMISLASSTRGPSVRRRRGSSNSRSVRFLDRPASTCASSPSATAAESRTLVPVGMEEAERFLAGLGMAIREQRRRIGWSQAELGTAANIHRNYIGGIERNEREPTIRVAIELGTALGLKPLELFVRAVELANRRG